MIKYVAPVLTALHNAKEVDVESCLKLYDYLINNNIDGIAVFGTSGEFPHIPTAEKKKLIKAAAPQIKNRAEYIVGTGTMNADETIELSCFAFDSGADAVIIVSPYYYGMTDDSIFEYYSKVADEVKGNIYLYNFPDRTSYSIKPKTVLELARAHANIIGIKDTVPDMGHTVDIIKTVKPEFPDFAVFSAYDNNFVYNILSGGNGCVAILANIAPKLFSDWVKAAREKNFDTLAEIQKKVDRLMDILWIYSPFLSTTKAILVDKGIFAKDLMTFPYLPFPEAKKRELRDFMKDFE
ncbi:MAG: dihydrodipicolinate synthase family protein [Prevotellaceae bacterium]|jgi:4-hydroxy-tetrahydrodipicolinate synthase|nr:dihydrodipicolinate synthase family protein [Prevotellaceae bacterium]